ncbi:MAG: class 3 adenylate cyclase/tetratricopeptide (TPR) repeat protein [Alphaproteobacteria bacterium]|jgi:class 3 adenylate cyclase/tetratricopeptide (TPR) repeat protein
MSDVKKWLEEIGLGEHAGLFADNDIDVDLLTELTDDDLKELGLSLGHRRRLLRAVSGGETVAKAPAETPTETTAEIAGERRQVTVLFADLAGFTQLSNSLDAEDVHGLLNRYFAVADGVIERHGGHVDKHMGDGLMAVFGAPVAHADDPERAVRAALDIHAAVADLDPPLSVHIGVASGSVVASGMGSDQHSEYTVIGDAVNLAARLQDLAVGGETLVSEAVQRFLAGRIEGDARGDVAVKGFEEPVSVWQVSGLAAPTTHRSALVGRGGELRQFDAALADCAEHGRGHVVYLRGEAGIGKTRLVDEFSEHAMAQGFACHTGLVLETGAGSDSDVIGALVRGLLDIGSEAGAAARIERVNAAVKENWLDDRQRVYLHDLLGLPQPVDLPGIYDAMDNGTRIEGKLVVLARLLECASERQPVMLRVEDLHWAEASLLPYLSRAASATGLCPVLMIMTSRIEGDPIDQAWRAGTRGATMTTIDLSPLREADALEMALAALPGAEDLARECVSRADGNPLFLDQLLRNADQVTGKELPASVQSIVLARMDSLKSEDRRALQAASVLGQRFALDALRWMLDAVEQTFEELIRYALLIPDENGLYFAHALVRDGVYGSLLTPRRRQWHTRAAEWFASREPVLYAEHLGQAEDPTAPQAYMAAARAEITAYRYERALALVGRGLAAATDRQDRYALSVLRAEILQAMGQPQDAIDVLRETLNIAETADEQRPLWIAIAAACRLLGDTDGGVSALGQAEALGHGADDRQQAQMHFYRATFHFASGEIDECLTEHQAALRSAEAIQDPEWRASAHGGLGDAYYARGQMRSALENFRRCIDLAERNGFGRIAIGNQVIVGNVLRYQNQLGDALATVTTAAEMARQIGNRRAEMYSLMLQGEFLMEGNDHRGAEVPLTASIAIAEGMGNERFASYPMHHLARARFGQGDRVAALKLLDDAIEISRRTGIAFLGPRILGLMAIVSDDPQHRKDALAEGEEVLAGGNCIAHNHFWFYRDAIGSALADHAWDAAERFADALDAYTEAERIPWVDLHIKRGRLLAALGRDPVNAPARDELKALGESANDAGQLAIVAEIVELLAK